MDIHKEFSLLLVTYETLLADYDLERIDFAQAEEQAFKHFDLITEFIRQEERERAAKIIEEAPDKEEFGACNDGDAYAEIGFNEHARKVKKWKQEALKKLNETV